jgi:hypothetical protein
MLMTKFEIVRMEQREVDELFDFRRRVFPENSKQMDKDRWRWLLCDVPDTDDGGMTTWLMKDDGRIVGTISGIPVIFNIQGRSVRGFFGADYFVEEAYKGLPALRLLKEMHKQVTIHVGMNLSESAKKLFVKLGYFDLSENFISASMTLNSSYRGVKGEIRRVFYRCLRKTVLNSDYDVKIVHSLGMDYSHLWDRVKESYPVIIEKNLEYMKWRYENCPTRKYRYVYLEKDNELIGLAIIAMHKVGKEVKGVIHDVILPHGATCILKNLLCRILEYFEKEDCQYCELQIMAPRALGLLKALGFRVEISSLGAMVLVKNQVEFFSAMQNPENWMLCIGDTDRY